MRKFGIVEKFAQANETSKDLVEMMTAYAKMDLTERGTHKYSVDSKFAGYSKEDLGKALSKAYEKDLFRRSGYTYDNFDGDVTAFGTHSAIVEFAQTMDIVLLNAVYPYVFNTPLFNTLCQVHFVGYGDALQFDIKDNTLFNVSKFARRQKHTKTQEKEKMTRTITTDNYGITTITNLPKILLGEANIAEDIMVSALSMERKAFELVLNKFIAKTNALSIGALTLQNYDEKKWLKVLKTVKAYSGNAQPLIVGDMIALKTLLPEAQNTRINLQDPYNTTMGYMDRFNGYNVVAFDAIANDDGAYGVTGLPEDRIYALPISGDKMIHLGIGATMRNSDADYENMNTSKLSTLRQEMGVELVTNEVLGVLKLA